MPKIRPARMPTTPATTTCRVPSPEAPPPPAFDANPVPPSLFTIRPAPEVSAPACGLSNELQGGRKAPVGGGPPAVHEHEGPGDVGARVGGEVDHHADHLVGLRPPAEDALVGVGAVPVGALLDLGGKRRLHDTRRYGVGPHPSRPELGG